MMITPKLQICYLNKPFLVIVGHMKILITSALFPPDVASPAPYVKELCKRLALGNNVSVLTYGNIPESVTDVKIDTVNKKLPAPLRLTIFTLRLRRAAKNVDVILVNNAPSTELPLLLVGFFYKKKMFLVESDQKIVYVGWRKLLHQLATSQVNSAISVDIPGNKPEITPFEDYPKTDLENWDKAWNDHITALTKLIS